MKFWSSADFLKNYYLYQGSVNSTGYQIVDLLEKGPSWRAKPLMPEIHFVVEFRTTRFMPNEEDIEMIISGWYWITDQFILLQDYEDMAMIRLKYG